MTLQTRAAALHTALFGTWKGPKRASRMTGRADQKYIDIPTYSFGAEHFAAHLAGRDTYAGTLGVLGTAWSGCKDYDDAGEAEMMAALATAAAKDITAVAFLLPGAAGEHSGGHLWTFYNHDYPESDIRAQLRTIPRSGKGEDYPSGNPVRLPFGYHKLKRTRGVLLLQDGRRFDLDAPDQLFAAIDAFLALPRNDKPEPTLAGDARVSGAAWGDAYKPDEWENLPDGGPLWHSAYVAAVASRPGREPLAALLRGERAVITKNDDTIDDSDSAQIAALCYNLLSGNVCEAHIRAIALHLKDTIRPGRALEHFKAHVDAELIRYRPTHYKPQPIRCPGVVQQAAPLPAPQHTPEPKSRARKDRPQKVTGALGYLAWLHTQVDPQSESVMLSQSQCAERLDCHVRTIKRYEKALGQQIERRIFAQRQAGCLFLLPPDVVTTSVEDVVIADPEIAQQHAENAVPATMQEEHTPGMPLPPQAARPAGVPPSPAPAGAAQAVGYSADGHRLDLAELVRDGLDAVTRPTFKRIKAYVRANAANPQAYSDNGIKIYYQRELKRRQWARQDARAAEKLRTMRSDVLKKKSCSFASQAANLHRKGDKRAPVFQRLAGLYAAEEARRAPPDQLTMHEQWAEVGAEYEQVHRELKKFMRPTVKAAAPVDSGIVERLHQLKAQREAAHG